MSNIIQAGFELKESDHLTAHTDAMIIVAWHRQLDIWAGYRKGAKGEELLVIEGHVIPCDFAVQAVVSFAGMGLKAAIKSSDKMLRENGHVPSE